MIFSLSCAFSGAVVGFDSPPLKLDALLARLPLSVFWTWLSIFVFCMHNQRQPDSVIEDSINKPWRPLPARRITIRQTNFLLVATYPIWYVCSWQFGGFRQCVGLTFLQLWYNEWGGSELSGAMRNTLNAAGYSCFLAGSLEVLLGPEYDVYNSKALEWLLMVCGLIITTIHTQDFRDEEGDRQRGRNTVQSFIGDAASRWIIIFASIFWSVFIPARLELGVGGWLLCGSAAGVLIFQIVQGLVARTLEKDVLAYKTWCFWFISVLLLPWVRLI
jgi:4-hydroxybenzoate polyprenyltransferase